RVVTSSLALPPGPQCAPGVFRKSYGFVTASLRWLAEPVANPADSIDSRRWQLGQDEFSAQPGEMDVHRPGLDEAVAAPDHVEQLVAAEDAARRSRENGEQLELLGRQLDGAALHPHLEAVPIDLKLAGLDESALGVFLGAHAAARDGPNARAELAWREGLGDVVVGAELEAEHLVTFLDAPGHHDHGDRARLRIFLQSPADLPTVEVRHHDVDQHDVGVGFAHALERLGARAGREHFPALFDQVVADQLGNVGLVLHHEHTASALRAGVARRALRHRIEHAVEAFNSSTHGRSVVR